MMMIGMMVMLMMMIGMMVMMTSCMLHCISLARAACLDAIQLLQNVLSSPRHGLSVLLVHYVSPVRSRRS